MPGRAVPRRTRADLIADIYDAALEPDAWPRFAAPFVEALDRKTAFFWIGDAGRVIESAVHGLPVSALERYAAYYGQADPWAAAAIDRQLALHAAIGSELVSERRFLESEFYFDYARGYDTVDAVGAAVPLGHGRLKLLVSTSPARLWQRASSTHGIEKRRTTIQEMGCLSNRA